MRKEIVRLLKIDLNYFVTVHNCFTLTQHIRNSEIKYIYYRKQGMINVYYI